MKDCKIVEDLLPLYEENLIQLETKQWIETHLAHCSQCREMASVELEALPKLALPEKSADLMMRHVQSKLTVYQLLFVLLSFAFAMQTSLLNESFAFILSYFILGAVTFFVYRNVLFTLLLAFVPTCLWTIFMTVDSYGSYSAWYTDQLTYYSSAISLFANTAVGGIFLAAIHTLFTVLGIIVVKLLIQAFRKEDVS